MANDVRRLIIFGGGNKDRNVTDDRVASKVELAQYMAARQRQG